MNKFPMLAASLMAAASVTGFAQDNTDIDALMGRMTLEEKIGQMCQLVGPKLTGVASSANREEKVRAGMVGSMLNIKGDALREMQRIAVEESRLGIPLVFGLDVIHGYETCFPIPLAMASSWNLKSIEEAAHIAGMEASRDGIAWTFTPMCDICRDPRWGRIAEGAGEDPYLGGEVAAAQVRGFQGNLDKPTDIAACVKHFALYGAPQAGRDYYTVDMSRQQMFNEYLWPYQAAINAGALTVMSSFNEFEGLPLTVHPYMLKDLLRDIMGFEGMLVTDYSAVEETIKHGTSPDLRDAAIKAANAGVDMEMVSEGFSRYLAAAVREGLVSEDVVNVACRRVLELKKKLGLFADPYKYCRPDELALNGSDENKAVARRVAAQSIVLLRNEGDVLPLAEGKKIAVIGPLADQSLEMLGAWNVMPRNHQPVTLLEGLKARFGDASVKFARGSHILDNHELETQVSYHKVETRGWDMTSEALLKEALKLARKSDVVVAALGETALMSGEGSSRSDITLPAPQRELLKALVATGKPVVLVVMAGRPLVLDWEAKNVAGIVYAWHLGSEAGNAIADVLSGDVNPSGRLTVSFPRSVGQIPINYNHKNSGRPVGDFSPYKKYQCSYIDVVNSPLYYFGYGLSYGKVEYSGLEVAGVAADAGSDAGSGVGAGVGSGVGAGVGSGDAARAAIGDEVEVKVTLTNKSAVDVVETPQLYVRDLYASITRPVMELKGFQQVTVKAGESVELCFKLDTDKLGFYGSDLKYVVEPGDFDIMVGPSADSRTQLKTRLTLVEAK